MSGKLDVRGLFSDLNKLVERSAGAVGGAPAGTPNPLSDSDLDELAEVVENPTFDIYVGKEDDTIRRVSGNLTVKVPEKDRARVNGISGGSLRFSIELTKVNGDQKVEAPAKSRPISDLTTQLRGAGALGRWAARAARAPRTAHDHPRPAPRARAARAAGWRPSRSTRSAWTRRGPTTRPPCRAAPSCCADPGAPIPSRDGLRGASPLAGAGRRRCVVFLWLDLHFFARGREPDFKEAVVWSIGWLVLSLAAALGGAGVPGAGGRRPLHHRLPDRALAVARQPVRLPAAVRLLRRADGAPRAAAVLGHRRGAGAARRLHPRRHHADRAVPLRDLPARRGAAGAGLPDLPGGRRERRSRQEPDGAPGAPLLPGDRRLPRGPLVREGGRPALGHAAVPVPGGDRVRRHRVRDRLDPGGVRHHPRPVPDLDGQRVRAARACGRCSCSSRA